MAAIFTPSGLNAALSLIAVKRLTSVNTMPRINPRSATFYIGLLLIGSSATVQAASATIPMTATIVAVQCTTEQRARIRACATPEQQSGIAPYKTIVTIEARTGQHNVFGPHHEILVDPSRQVAVKTLLY